MAELPLEKAPRKAREHFEKAFVAFERVGGVIAYDLSDPTSPTVEDYANTRFPEENPLAGISTQDDLGPEDVVFIPASDSPNGEALLAVPHEVSGSVVVFQLNP